MVVQSVHLLGMAMPLTAAECIVDQCGKLGIRPHEPTAMRDAVRLVVELARRIVVKILERCGFQDTRMDLRNAVDAVPADNRETRHVDYAVLNDGERTHLVLIVRIAAAHLFKMAAVDLVNNHVDARQERAEHVNAPRLKCLGHDRVVRIADRVARDRPRILPSQLLLIDEDAHELRHAERGMRVVDVNADLLAEVVDAHARLLVVTDNALHTCRNKEVLLNETHTASLKRAVVRIEIARNRLNKTAVVVALLDLLLRQHTVVGEVAVDLGVPHAQRVDRRVVVADNRHIIRHCHDDHRVLMDKLQFAIPHVAHIGVAAELDIHGLVRLAVLPCKAVAQPVVGNLDLIAADNLLLEEPVLIADRAAMPRETMRRQRVNEARRKATEAAVAETCVRLCLVRIREVQLEVPEDFLQSLLNAEVDKVGFQEATEQELNGEVVDLLLLALAILLVRLDPVIRDGLLGGCCDCLVDLNLRQFLYLASKHHMRGCDKTALEDLFHRLESFPCRSVDLILLCQIVHSFSKLLLSSPTFFPAHGRNPRKKYQKQEAVIVPPAPNIGAGKEPLTAK